MLHLQLHFNIILNKVKDSSEYLKQYLLKEQR